jgi:hypothetical protein
VLTNETEGSQINKGYVRAIVATGGHQVSEIVETTMGLGD